MIYYVKNWYISISSLLYEISSDEKHRTHREQVINIFHYIFQEKHWKYQIFVNEKYVLVISLIMFYDNRMAVVYKLIGSVTYSLADNFLCINYLGIVQKKLSDLTYNKSLKREVQWFFLGWVFLKFLWVSCHVMVFKNDNINSNYYMFQCYCAILFVKIIYHCWKSRRSL